MSTVSFVDFGTFRAWKTHRLW